KRPRGFFSSAAFFKTKKPRAISGLPAAFKACFYVREASARTRQTRGVIIIIAVIKPGSA
ncbi:MAG: hypothetical protein ACLFRO_04895, partial [Desulfobacterales bacterium]